MEWLQAAKYNWELNARTSQRIPEGSWNTWIINAGRGFGKDLAASTRIVTLNSGVVTLNSIKVGDTVFAWDGSPTRVVNVYRPAPRQLVQFYFHDESNLISSVEHEWATWTLKERTTWATHNEIPLPKNWITYGSDKQKWSEIYVQNRVKTTQEIIETFEINGAKNHSIPVPKPLLGTRTLDYANYLGYWLARGFPHNAGTLLVPRNQINWFKNSFDEPNGYEIQHSNNETVEFTLSVNNPLREKINKLGVLMNKRIPTEMLTADLNSRLLLLNGLMDSIGENTDSGVRISIASHQLAQDLMKLLRGLGQLPKLEITRDAGYQISWLPLHGYNPFSKFKPKIVGKPLDHHRIITGWRTVDYEPTVCIEVDHPDHLFLAGEELIPTHNTRVGAEAVRYHVNKLGYRAIGLIAPTAADARDTMIDGKGGSSLLEISHPNEKLMYYPTKRKLMWGNGAVGNSYSAEEPERLRGPQNDLIWSDEFASWGNIQDTYDMAMFGLRLGQNPRHIITTTPKPIPFLKELLKDAVPASEMKPGMKAEVVYTRGSTMENSDNLAPQFLETLKKKYEGTRLGRQEIYAELLEDNPNALFNQDNIDKNRVEWVAGGIRRGSRVQFRYIRPQGADRPQTFWSILKDIIVAIDPSMGSNATSDETGMIVMAVDEQDSLFALEDVSGIMTPNEWGRKALQLYLKYDASSVVAEVNQGGELVEHVIRTAQKEMGISRVDYKKVRASKGKISRAEPVGALEEQGRIHHVGDMPKLEDQLVTFQPGYSNSPDRLDAYVWGAYHLVISKEKKGFFIF
jgi:phage terminase large subunit-like protein